jgi:predicted transposase YdaD
LNLRVDYASIALIFADRVGRNVIWENKLQKDWNMTESPFLNQFIAQGEARGEARGRLEGRIEGRVEGRIEGRVEGRFEEARALLLRLGAKRFGTAPSAIQEAVHAIADRERLERISERILEASDWNDLLATA